MTFLQELAEAHYNALTKAVDIGSEPSTAWEYLEPVQRKRRAAALLAALELLPHASERLIRAAAYCEQRSSPIAGMRDSLRALLEAAAQEAGLSGDPDAAKFAGVW